MADIFPPRNLPDRAQQWGRAIEGAITADERSLLQVSQSVDNSGRASSGQLAVLGRSLDEVANRSTESVVLPSISVSGAATAEPFPRIDTPVSFSSTSKERNALVTFSGTVSTSDPAIFVRLYAYLIYRGEIIGANWAQPAVLSSTPVEWQNNAPIFIQAPLTTDDLQPPVITVRLVRAADAFSPGTSTLTLVNPILTLTRSGAS